MAGARFSYTTFDSALAANTAKDILAITAPSTGKIAVSKWWVDFDGVTAGNNQAKVQFDRATGSVSGGTTVSSGIVVNHVGNPATPQSALMLGTVGTPTLGETLSGDLEGHRWHPTTDHMVEYALGEEIEVTPSGIVVWRITAAQVVNVTLGVIWRE